jgi:hypothetical protein
VRMLTMFIWLRMGKSGGLLWTRQWTFISVRSIVREAVTLDSEFTLRLLDMLCIRTPWRIGNHFNFTVLRENILNSLQVSGFIASCIFNYIFSEYEKHTSLIINYFYDAYNFLAVAIIILMFNDYSIFEGCIKSEYRVSFNNNKLYDEELLLVNIPCLRYDSFIVSACHYSEYVCVCTGSYMEILIFIMINSIPSTTEICIYIYIPIRLYTTGCKQ